MYIRKSVRRYKGKTYTNYVLVESVNTPRGPRQKAVCSLGDLGPKSGKEWLALAHRLEDALVGQDDLLGEDPEVAGIVAKVKARRGRPRRAAEAADAGLIAVDPAKVTSERHREAGPVHAGLQIWRRLGLDGILGEAGITDKVRRRACAMTLNRLIAPRSEHAMPAWIRSTTLPDLLGAELEDLDEAPLYRTLDALHPHRAAIEAALTARERSLFNLDPTIYLYDLTSTYFEGLALANPKARRGYSRDKRPDCKQVVVGLVVGREGFPIAHEVFAGNTQDRTTLAAMLDLLGKRVGLEPGSCVIVDRGMAYDENIAELEARGLHYVVAARQPERDRWLAEFGDAEGFEAVLRTPSPTNPFQRKTKVTVKMVRQGGETVVLCRSDGRIAKDRAIREKHEHRFLADVAKLQRRIAAGRLVKPEKIAETIGRLKERYPRVARYWRMDYDAEARTLIAAPDEARRAKAEALDGCYLLKTDRTDLTAADAWRLYSLLTRAEAAFRDMKTPLAERPIFHQVTRRVESHIFLCVLAYHLLVAIENTLRDQGVHTSWAGVRDALKTHQLCTIVLPTTSGAVLRIRKGSTPEPEHRELYRLLHLPTDVIRPKRHWTPPN